MKPSEMDDKSAWQATGSYLCVITKMYIQKALVNKT